MQYEGEHKQIVLRGIERAMANGVAQDGGLNEIIDLIPRNGSLVPYSPKDVTDAYASFITSDTKMVRVHHTSTGDNTIIVFDNYYTINPEWVTVEEEGVERQEVSPKIMKSVRNIVFIGNRMDLETANGIEHWLCKNGEYVNADNLNSHSGSSSPLPYVNFKVSRGIYDGSKVYGSARYVRLHKNYTDADTSSPAEDDAKEYVQDISSMGSDAYALLDGIRHAGGITGYVLVAAAWRLKGSDVSKPKYIMASPVLLMGTPEIYIKDDMFELEEPTPQYDYVSKPERFLLEMYDKDTLWSNADFFGMKDSDDRKAEDMVAGEHYNIELFDEESCDLYNEVDDVTNAISNPALWSNKVALFGIDYEHRGVRLTHGSGNCLEYRLNANVPEQYKDEIDRLCIFVSPVVSPYKSFDESGIRMEYNGKYKAHSTMSHYGGAFISYQIYIGSFMPVMKSSAEIRDELKNVAGLYKMAEYHLNELQPGEWLKVNLSDGRLETDKMVQKSDTMLKISDMQPVGFTEGQIFGYNERLHVFNLKKNQVYRLPYESLCYYGGAGQYKLEDSDTDWRYKIEVKDSNDSTIIATIENATSGLNPLISCADIDAKEIRVLKYRPMYPVIYEGSAAEITKSPIEIAGVTSGYINTELGPIQLTTQDYEDLDPFFHEEDIKPDSSAWGKNEIRVSNTGTTIFELDKSYKVGHGEIIALARLSMGLSQDNYSKFPLVVFCTDGVYTLGVDSSGKYAYYSQDPLSRVVCTNKNGICEIDGAVLFPTEFGLQMVTSDGVKPVALAAIGQPTCNPDDIAIYKAAVSYQKIVTMYPSISSTDFLSDIQDSNTYIRYIQALNSVIVYNESLSYSYLIDLGTWTVTKIRQTIALDNGDYPKQKFWQKSISLSPVEFDYYSGRDNEQTLIVTRPIMLETQHMKTAYRVVMRGVFDYTTSGEEERYAVMCVFGSLDGENWDFLNSTEKLLTGNRFHDIGVETHHVSYKYLMVVFAGNLSKDSHIEGMEITSNVKYNNKLK